MRFTPSAEYAFHHPLIRAVAYESQLKSDRAQWHRRLAAAIQQHAPGAVEDNAALIAEHLEAAGELHAAYGWHMRAAAWSTNRDSPPPGSVGSGPAGSPTHYPTPTPAKNRSAGDAHRPPHHAVCHRLAGHQAIQESRGRFAELRELCSAAGDKVSLAIGMSGMATELLMTGVREGSRLASEQVALLESIGDPTLTIGLAFMAFSNWFNTGEFDEILRWSQTVIDLAGGDPAKGAGFGIGSPLAIAVAFRGIARWSLGRPGWRQDLHDAVAMARTATRQPSRLSSSGPTVCDTFGVLRADDAVLRASEEAVQIATGQQRHARCPSPSTRWVPCCCTRDAAADRRRGLELMVQAREWQREHAPFMVPVTELWIARERARQGDRDAAIAVMRESVDELHQAGRLRVWRFRHRRSGGDTAGPWRRGRPGRSPRGVRLVGQPASGRGSAILRSRCCGCARC